MKKKLQDRNVFEYQRVVEILKEITEKINDDDDNYQLVKELCNELCEREKKIKSLDPMEDIDKIVITMAVNGADRSACIEAYCDCYKNIKLSYAEECVESLCGVYF